MRLRTKKKSVSEAILNAGQEAARRSRERRRARRLDEASARGDAAWRDQRGRDCREGQAECAHLTYVSRNQRGCALPRTEGKVTKETTRPYYSSVSQRDDGLWYYIGRDGQTHGPFATERNAVKAERAQWERAEDAK
jgi:hypothetical protein